MRISEIPHVDHGRIAVCPCRATFRIDDATVVEEYSLPDLPPPETIGRYRILRYVGRGASNCVYEGTDPDTGAHVAIKTLLPDYAADKPSREQFLRAAKIYAKTVHPNIVKVFETGKNADGVPFLAMEFLSGGTLSDRMTGDRHFSVRETAEIGVAICRALSVTSGLGIVHRDIKPDNIMISADGQYKLTDLGLAKFDASSTTGSPALVLDEAAQAKPPVKTSFGTLEYMSPEQYIDAEACDIRSDIYSLGVTLYNLAAGRLPFEPQTRSELRHMHLSVEPVVPSTFVPEIPIDFDYIVLHCIQKNPDDRYRTPDELLADLEAFLAGQPLPSTTSGAVPVVHSPSSSLLRAAKTGRPWFLPAVAAVLILLILCLAGLLLLTGRKGQKQTPPAGQKNGESDFEVTGQDAVAMRGNAESADIFAGEDQTPPRRSSSKKMTNDDELLIVDKEKEAWIAALFEEAKEKAEKALEHRDGISYQDAIDEMENFVDDEESSFYSERARAIIYDLKKAAAVEELMAELDKKAAPLIEAHEWEDAVNVYRTGIDERLEEGSEEQRNQKILEIERMRRNDASEGDSDEAASSDEHEAEHETDESISAAEHETELETDESAAEYEIELETDESAAEYDLTPEGSDAP